jgi:hypothetical protein
MFGDSVKQSAQARRFWRESGSGLDSENNTRSSHPPRTSQDRSGLAIAFIVRESARRESQICFLARQPAALTLARQPA